MNAAATREKRAKDLEAKKKKLEQLRASKAARMAAPATAPAAPTAGGGIAPAEAAGEDFDDYLNGLLSSAVPGSPAPAPPPAEPAVAPADAPAVVPANAVAPAPGAQPTSAPPPLAERLARLTMSDSIAVIDIPSTAEERTEMYDKGCQAGTGEIGGSDDEEGQAEQQQQQQQQPPPPANAADAAAEAAASDSEAVVARTAAPNESKDRGVALSTEERSTLMAGEAFQAFLGRSATLVERALAQSAQWDFMVDYADDGQGGGVAPAFRPRHRPWTRRAGRNTVRPASHAWHAPPGAASAPALRSPPRHVWQKV